METGFSVMSLRDVINKIVKDSNPLRGLNPFIDFVRANDYRPVTGRQETGDNFSLDPEYVEDQEGNTF